MSESINFEKTGSRSPEELVDEVLVPATPKKLGVALVGLGKYSSGQLAPALLETKNCYLAGIVSGSPEKTREWQVKYNIPEQNIYNYENFDTIKENDAIDIVYVVLPNALHAEYVIRAARAGKHVICEKPMAVSVQECDEMIKACKEAGKLLSIGYRLHFEPHHRDMMHMGQSKIFGELTHIHATHGLADPQGWRLDKTLAGGGPLMDVGIYSIQAARYVTGMEPVAVNVKDGNTVTDDKFHGIEDQLSWDMEFSNGLVASCETSYRQELNSLHADAAHGWFELSPAYSYEGINGKTATGFIDLPNVNQQALQMDDFALCVLNGKPSKVPGEMGRTDVKIIEAIYESMRTRKRVEIKQTQL